MISNKGINIPALVGFLVAVIFAVLYSFSVSVCIVILCCFFGIFFETRLTQKSNRSYLFKLLLIVLSVYIVSAIIFSLSYSSGSTFVTQDSYQYFDNLSLKRMDVDPTSSLISCYLLLDDNNELHELFIRYCIIFANNHLGGANILYLLLINVLFGLLAIGPVYRILLKIVPQEKAYRYTLAFALLSPFHFYSVAFVRDIIVACFYAHTIEIVLNDFKFRRLVLLIIFVVVVWGVRLYSGLFIFAFIAYYLFKLIKSSRIVIIGSVLLIILAAPYLGEMLAIKQSLDEIEHYREYNTERASSSSLSVKLESLPPVAREVSLVLYAQIMPFPPYVGSLDSAKSFPEYYASILMCLFEVYWYFIAFGLLTMLIFKRGYTYLSTDDWVLLGIVLLYIFLNTSQVDIRRVMAIYPLMLYLYVKIRCVYLHGKNMKMLNQVLAGGYIGLILLYTIIK